MVFYRVTPPMHIVSLWYGIKVGHIKICVDALAVAIFVIVIVVHVVQVAV